MNEMYKEIVVPNCVEVIYTILRTYERCDGEVVAECKMIANNITPTGVVENDCGICNDISLSVLKKMERINYSFNPVAFGLL